MAGKLDISFVLEAVAGRSKDFGLFVPTLVAEATLALAGNFLADADADVDVRRRDKPERLADGLQVKGLDVEDVLQRMRLVGTDVGLEGFLGAQVQEIVLRDEFLQLEKIRFVGGSFVRKLKVLREASWKSFQREERN